MDTLAQYAARLKEETQKIIVGKDRQIELILMAVFSMLVLCSIPNWIILIAAGVCLVIYELVLITKDKSVKKLLSLS